MSSVVTQAMRDIIREHEDWWQSEVFVQALGRQVNIEIEDSQTDP